MARTKTVLNGAQHDALSKLSLATEHLQAFDQEWERQRRARLVELEQLQANALHGARALGIPQRLLLPALGTTNPGRIYLIEARFPLTPALPTTPLALPVAPVRTWADVLEVVPTGTDNVYRLRTTSPIPLYMWTYLQSAPDKYAQNLSVPTEPWEGWSEFAYGYPTSDKSDPVVNPLGAQWSYDGADLRAMLAAAGCYDPATNPTAYGAEAF